jgi:tetratricopeptide (TPR) repeat protein
MLHSKKYHILYFLCLFGLFLPHQVCCQREVIVKRSLSVKNISPSTSLYKCNYGLLIPANRPGKQEAVQYTYPGIKPHHFNKTKEAEYYVVWNDIDFQALKTADLEVSIKIKLYTYDLKTAKKHPVKDTSDRDTLQYLKSEENFNINAKNIKEATAEITGTEREDIVKSIFNYVTGSLDYHIFYDQDRGAKKALKDGRGDCTEYSELMVTLCRAKKIPARIVMGLIPSSSGKVGHHNWVEVYFPSYGWVAFDPTWGDSPKGTTTFYAMKNTYVQLSNKRYIQSILCPWYSGEDLLAIKLKDTCMDLSKDAGEKYDKMIRHYNHFEYRKAADLLDTLLTYEPDNYMLWLYQGMIHAKIGDYEKGYAYLQVAFKNAEFNYEKFECLYTLSEFYGLKGDGENAVKYLRETVDAGFDNYSHLYADPDFTKIKNYPPFIEFLDALKEKEKEKLPKKKR